MIPLITKFNSNVVLYDSLGSTTNNYISFTYDKNYIYFLNDTYGNITSYNTKTEELSSIKLSYNNPINSIIKYRDEIYGFEGYDAKQFVNDTVLYVKDNILLVQESFDQQIKAILLSSSTEISDFFVDDDYNYYVVHNKNTISKFSKERILQAKITITPYVSSVFNSLSVMPNDEIQILKLDYVREYTENGLSSYPIILGKIKNGSGHILSPCQLFLAKLQDNLESVSFASFIPLTANYYSYGDVNRINYNLTNYNYLKNSYTKQNKLTLKVVLQNIYNNKDKTYVEIPISTEEFISEYHHFAFRMDGIDGSITVFCDGKEIQKVYIQKGQYIFQDIFSDSINVGNTYFNNNISLPDYLNQNNYYINNATIKQFKIYNKSLTNNEIEFHVYRGINMSDLIVSLPCDQRNELDGIERQFKLDTTGNKSNKINIIIKNSQIYNDNVQNNLKEVLLEKMKEILPITTTVNNIEFR